MLNSENVFSALQTALAGRVKLICIRSPSPGVWSLDSSAPSMCLSRIGIGLVADSAHAYRLVDCGPQAGDAALAFRNFWGPKAELRRFKDGSTRECLRWSDDPEDGDPVQQATSFVLARHLGNTPASGGTWMNMRLGCGSHEQVEHAFNDLQRAIQSIEEVPLKVRDLRLVTPGCRFGRSLTRAANQDTRLIPWAEVNIQLEGSSRWPDDFPAIQRTKCAYLLRLRTLLKRTWTSSDTSLGIKATYSSPSLSSPYLDVRVGTVMLRLRLSLERDTMMLDRLLQSHDCGFQRRDVIAQVRSCNIRNIVMAPRHATAMDTLSTRYPSLNQSVEIFRYWCASHLLSHYLRDELIETLVACVYTRPHPYAVPACPRTGFFRTLALLARWDWMGEPLMVELDSQITSADAAAIDLRFRAWRKIDPSMNRVTLIVGTSLDPGGVVWTQGRIPPLVASRLRALAQASIIKIQEGTFHLQTRPLFTTPLSQYDFLVRLKSPGNLDRVLANPQSERYVKPANKSSYYWSLVHDFVADLSRQYDGIAIFFHGKEGTVIAGLWSPSRVRQPWKAVSDYSAVPIGIADGPGRHALRARTLMAHSRSAVLNEIARLGEGLVLGVTVGK